MLLRADLWIRLCGSFGRRFYRVLKSKARGEQTRVRTKEQKSMVATEASCLGGIWFREDKSSSTLSVFSTELAINHWIHQITISLLLKILIDSTNKCWQPEHSLATADLDIILPLTICVSQWLPWISKLNFLINKKFKAKKKVNHGEDKGTALLIFLKEDIYVLWKSLE